MKKLWLLVALLLCLALTCATAEKEPTLYISGDFAYTLLEDGTAEITYYVGEATSLVIPSSLNRYSVTSIGDAAFHNRNSLTSITIPDSIVSMGGNPFGYCRNLTTIKVSPDHPVFATIDGVLFDKTEKKLICYPYAFTAEFYSIPQGILSIGDDAFYYCDSLTSITIPDSITSIGDDAFSECLNLKSITVPRDSYAAQYCKDNDLPYTYPDANDWLLN